MSQSLAIVGAGIFVGLVYGAFGVGSAFATPILALLGVPGMAAVVAPLPSLLPGSAAGAWSYSKGGKVDWRLAGRASIFALPAAVAGAALSSFVGGPLLLVASGLVLLFVGIRVLRPGACSVADEIAARRRASWLFIGTTATAIGFFSGLLANGGGFLLVPLFLLLLGLDMNQAAGTSLIVAAAVTLPTLATHAALGHVNWMIAVVFAAGMVPGALVGGRLAQRLPVARLKVAFGFLLVFFALWFLTKQGAAFAAELV